jgi:glutamyl-tRNA synthetase
MKGIESKNRNLTIEENLRIWDLMIKFDPTVREYCVRGKISIDNKNKCLRDPVFYRFNEEPHHRTGEKFKVNS